MDVEGVATTIPATLAILTHDDFVAARHSTRWVEERLDLSGVHAAADPPSPPEGAEHLVTREVDAEVDGRRYRVKLWVPDTGVDRDGAGRHRPRQRPPPGRVRRPAPRSALDGRVTVPMQGTIVKVLVQEGDPVEADQTFCVLEAMKMENPINSDRAGTVTELRVTVGDSLGAGDVVAVIE